MPCRMSTMTERGGKHEQETHHYAGSSNNGRRDFCTSRAEIPWRPPWTPWRLPGRPACARAGFPSSPSSWRMGHCRSCAGDGRARTRHRSPGASAGRRCPSAGCRAAAAARCGQSRTGRRAAGPRRHVSRHDILPWLVAVKTPLPPRIRPTEWPHRCRATGKAIPGAQGGRIDFGQRPVI